MHTCNCINESLIFISLEIPPPPTHTHTPLSLTHTTHTQPNLLLGFQARVNVPGLGERTVQRDIARSQFTTGSEVQVHVCRSVFRYWN